MAPVILSMDVHCDGCAKKIQKAVMKLPAVDSVTFGTGLVVIEGTADAAALRARLQAKTGKAVNVVSGDGGVSGYASPPPPAPIILEMELHYRSCAKKVEKRVTQIPGVDTMTTDVGASRVEVIGTADASAVATSLQVRTRGSVRVVSDSRRLDFPGYDHEQRKAVAAWAVAQLMYGEPREAATDPSGASSSVPLPAAPCCRRQRRRRTSTSAPAPSPPVQTAGSGNPHPSPPLQAYGAPPPQAAGAGYYYPAVAVYGGQYWAAAPSQPPVGFYTGQWPAYQPPEGYYPWQGDEVYGGQQMWAPFQQDENPHICRVQ